MSFRVEPMADLPEVRMVEPLLHRDERGLFFESWRADRFAELGIEADFVQDNHSESRRGVLRGLHYQLPPAAQGKLVRVAAGRVFDVAVDVRRSSPTVGRWVGVELSSDDHRMLWIPPGFAHGFYTLSDRAVVQYKCTAPYSGELDRSLRWDDPEVGVEWPIDGRQPSLSAKDEDARPLRDADLFP